MKQTSVTLLVAASALAWMPCGMAADVFSVAADFCEQAGNGSCGAGNPADYMVRFGTSNAEQLFEALEDRNLERLVVEQSQGEFDGNEIVAAQIDFRGVNMTMAFETIGGSELDFSIPALAFQRSFDGGTRENSIDQLIDFLQSNENDILSRLAQQLARDSSTDPVAGNPGSMQAQVAQADFRQAFTQRVSQVWGCSTGASAEQKLMLARAGFSCLSDVADKNFRLPAVEVAQIGTGNTGLYDDYFSRYERLRGANKLSLGLDYSQISATPGGGTELQTSVLTVPLSYTFVFNSDPRKKLILRAPLSFVDTEGARSYQVSVGIAYNYPMTDAWTLTPSAGYSAVGSEDLAAAAALLSYSVASSFSFSLGDWGFNIGNLVGHYATQKLTIGEYESDPGISNTVFTNGVLISGPNSLLANDLVVEYYLNDTRYTGDDLFTDNAQEFGVNFGKLQTSSEVVTSFIKGGVSYTMASGDNGNKADVLRLSLNFKF